jgi:3-oxoisoapionate decarboxylase
MKIGIDSYCWHRFFGEVFAEQPDPGERRTLDDLIAEAKRLGVDGLSVESAFMPSLDEAFLRDLRAKLDAASLERVLAWGHPRGLHMGKSPEAVADLRAHFRSAEILGAKAMRIVCGNFSFRGQEPVQDQIGRVVPVLKALAAEAGDRGLTLGVENHGDFSADELIEVVTKVGSPHLGVTLDFGNNLRILEDPVLECVKLAPYAVSTHVKDVTATGVGSPRYWRTFFPGVGLGKGIINIRRILQALKDCQYAGLLFVELDLLAPGLAEDEELEASVEYLRNLLPTLA